MYQGHRVGLVSHLINKKQKRFALYQRINQANNNVNLYDVKKKSLFVVHFIQPSYKDADTGVKVS